MINITETRQTITNGGMAWPRLPETKKLFGDILDELEANRKRIAALEDRIVYDPVTKEKIIRQVIIPQAGDAQALKDAIEAVEYFWVHETKDKTKEVLARYLSAIEVA